MALSKSWWEWWRSFLGLAGNGSHKTLEILLARYLELNQRAARFKAHAEKMQYPQFREKLLAIAADEAKHADLLAEQIKMLGASLPFVPPLYEDSEKTSWQYLLDDLNEEQLCSANLIEQAKEVRDELPPVAEVLVRIYQDSHKHCEALREMLMRSDTQSH